MTHLGDRVGALADGELPVEVAARANAHLAECPGCRELLAAERAVKEQLAALRAPEPGADLTARLLALGGPSGPLPPRPAHVPGSPRPRPVQAPGREAGARRHGVTVAVPPVPIPTVAGPIRSIPPMRPLPGIRPLSGLRPGSVRPGPARPAGERPAGRGGTAAARRVASTRMVVAVLGALTVVGAGASADGGITRTTTVARPAVNIQAHPAQLVFRLQNQLPVPPLAQVAVADRGDR